MSTLAEIESAIKQLSPAERARLARWWKANFDPDEGLELQEEVVMQLDVAQNHLHRTVEFFAAFREIDGWSNSGTFTGLGEAMEISRGKARPRAQPPVREQKE